MDMFNKDESQIDDLVKNPFHQRQMLIRCGVTANDGAESVRMVEYENFRLWEYLMTQKHGLKIHDLFLCLWVCEEEYQNNKEVFSLNDEDAAVNHIVVELYDGEYGFTNTINRFVPESDTDLVIGILTSHIPKHLFNSKSCQIEVIKGRSIEQWKHSTDKSFMIGLDG